MRPLLALAALLPLAASAQPAAPPDGGGLPPAAAVGVSLAVPAAGVALALAAAGSGGDQFVLAAAALTVGPSTGNLIQGEWNDAAIGFGLRAGGTLLAAGSLAATFWTESDAELAVLEATAVAGGVLVLAGAAYDVATAGVNAHRQRVAVAPSGAGLALRVGL